MYFMCIYSVFIVVKWLIILEGNFFSGNGFNYWVMIKCFKMNYEVVYYFSFIDIR